MMKPMIVLMLARFYDMLPSGEMMVANLAPVYVSPTTRRGVGQCSWSGPQVVVVPT